MARVTVRDLMTSKPFTLPPDASLDELHELMDAKQVRHVPVVDEDGQLCGVCSHRDLVRGALHGDRELPISTLHNMLQTFKIEEIMVSEPETIEPDDDIVAAGSAMIENKFGCLLVVENDELVGILTEADFVRYVVDISS